MTELRCTRCGGVNFSTNQICKVCDIQLIPASQLTPGTLIFPGPRASSGLHGSTHTTLDSIRPLTGVTDILGPTIRLLIENFWLITKIVVVIVAPFQLLATFSFKGVKFDSQLSIELFFLELLCQILIAPALIYALMQVMQTGKAPGVHEAYRWGFDKLGKLLGCAGIAWLLEGLGLVLCFVPAIIVAVSLILVQPLAVLEKSSVSEVLLDSKDLTKGHRWNIFGAMLILWLLILFFSLLAQGFAGHLLSSNFNFWPLAVIMSILSDIIEQSTTILALVTYLSIRALSSQPTQ